MKEAPPKKLAALSSSLDPRLFEDHRRALTGHCYRMLGSVFEADDAVQETMLRAHRALDKFEGRSSLRTWLYRIATRVCLDALADRQRRERPMDLGPASSIHGEIVSYPASRWVEPIPDRDILPEDVNPEQRAMLKESIRLAFVTSLQRLPPRQRAALLLTQVLDFSAAEAAEALEMTVAAVNSALQRARATLESRQPAPLSGEPSGELSANQAAILERYVDAFEAYDIDALRELLHADAKMSMPPYALWLQGYESIGAWMLGPGAGCRGSRLVETSASGSAAFGQYRPSESGEGKHEPWALVVLEFSGDRIAELSYFLDAAALFPRFGLPTELISA